MVPVDFSAPSEELRRRVPRLSVLGTREVALIHVLAPLSTARTVQRIKSRLAAACLELEDQGIQAAYLLRDGTPATEICNAAAEEESDLIYIAACSRSLVRCAILGSTVGDVVRLSNRPVLVQKSFGADPDFPGRIPRVLLATDFSAGSGRALECVKGLRPAAAEVVVLHVGVRAADPESEKHRVHAVEQRLAAVADELRALGYRTETVHDLGSTSRLINETAWRKQVSLIVIGRISGGLTEAVLGSTAGAVVRSSRPSVLLVP